MTEPLTGGVAAGIYKLLCPVLGLTLAGAVVMLITHPRDSREWALGILCTIASSLGGGSALVMHFGLQAWAADFFGLVALGGFYFVAGLPGWVVVRWWFAWIARNPDRNPLAAIKEARDDLQ